MAAAWRREECVTLEATASVRLRQVTTPSPGRVPVSGLRFANALCVRHPAPSVEMGVHGQLSAGSSLRIAGRAEHWEADHVRSRRS